MPAVPAKHTETNNTPAPLLVLIAGPYLSGTDGDPVKIAANRIKLDAAAWPIYQRDHLPLLGEWLPSCGASEGVQP